MSNVLWLKLDFMTFNLVTLEEICPGNVFFLFLILHDSQTPLISPIFYRVHFGLLVHFISHVSMINAFPHSTHVP